MMTVAQRRVVRGYKGLEHFAGNRVILAADADGRPISALKPIDTVRSRDPEIISALTRWRLRYADRFMSRFAVSEARTAKWLAQVVLACDDRILFVITGERGELVGNVGVASIDSQQAELDNVIRGEARGRRRIMYFTELALMKWIYQQLGVQRVFLRVLSDNAEALAHYAAVGFGLAERRALTQVEKPDGIALAVDPSRIPTAAERSLVIMRFDKAAFFDRHARAFMAHAGISSRE